MLCRLVVVRSVIVAVAVFVTTVSSTTAGFDGRRGEHGCAEQQRGDRPASPAHVTSPVVGSITELTRWIAETGNPPLVA